VRSIPPRLAAAVELSYAGRFVDSIGLREALYIEDERPPPLQLLLGQLRLLQNRLDEAGIMLAFSRA
jgi:hypothetical protein